MKMLLGGIMIENCRISAERRGEMRLTVLGESPGSAERVLGDLLGSAQRILEMPWAILKGQWRDAAWEKSK
jgi:hypothetical protein